MKSQKIYPGSQNVLCTQFWSMGLWAWANDQSDGAKATRLWKQDFKKEKWTVENKLQGEEWASKLHSEVEIVKYSVDVPAMGSGRQRCKDGGNCHTQKKWTRREMKGW